MARGLSCSAVGGVLPDQGSNLCILHWQADSLPPSHWGSPKTGFLNWAKFPWDPKSRVSQFLSFHYLTVHSMEGPVCCYNQSPAKEHMGCFQVLLLWMRLLWTFMYRSFREHMCFSDINVSSQQDPLLENLTYTSLVITSLYREVKIQGFSLCFCTMYLQSLKEVEYYIFVPIFKMYKEKPKTHGGCPWGREETWEDKQG